MYLDAVLDKDLKPIFNGTRAETRAWIVAHRTDDSMQVCIGETMKLVSIGEYLNKYRTP